MGIEDRRQKTEDRSRKTEVGRQKLEDRSWKLKARKIKMIQKIIVQFVLSLRIKYCTYDFG